MLGISTRNLRRQGDGDSSYCSKRLGSITCNFSLPFSGGDSVSILSLIGFFFQNDHFGYWMMCWRASGIAKYNDVAMFIASGFQWCGGSCDLAE